MSVVSIMAFVPVSAGTVSLSVTNATGRVSVSVPESNAPQSWRIYNAGVGTVYVETGDSTVTASASTGMPIASGDSVLVTVFRGSTHLAAITSGTDTATVFVTPGYGS